MHQHKTDEDTYLLGYVLNMDVILKAATQSQNVPNGNGIMYSRSQNCIRNGLL